MSYTQNYILFWLCFFPFFITVMLMFYATKGNDTQFSVCITVMLMFYDVLQCTIHNVLYTMYYTQCTIHNVLYTMYYTQCTIQYILYTMYCNEEKWCTVFMKLDYSRHIRIMPKVNIFGLALYFPANFSEFWCLNCQPLVEAFKTWWICIVYLIFFDTTLFALSSQLRNAAPTREYWLLNWSNDVIMYRCNKPL